MSDTVHLQPIVLIGPDGPALWRLSEGPLAVAMFSRVERAEAYAREASGGPWTSRSLQPSELVRLLAECVRGGVAAAVLDPSPDGARRVFDLTAVLRRVRDDLRAGRPLTWEA